MTTAAMFTLANPARRGDPAQSYAQELFPPVKQPSAWPLQLVGPALFAALVAGLVMASSWQIDQAIDRVRGLLRPTMGANVVPFGQVLDALVGIALAVWFVAFFAMIPIGGAAIERAERRECPDSRIVQGLLTILLRLNQQPRLWETLAGKRNITAILEDCARYLERELPRQVASGDAPTDMWFAAAAGRRAQALRALKRSVLSTGVAGRDPFLQVMAQMLLCAARGEWDAFPESEDEPAPARHIWRGRLVTWVASAFVASAPAGATFAFERLQLLPGGAPLDLVKLFGYVWFICTLLSALDTGFSARLEAFRSIVNLLLPWKGGKE